MQLSVNKRRPLDDEVCDDKSFHSGSHFSHFLYRYQSILTLSLVWGMLRAQEECNSHRYGTQQILAVHIIIVISQDKLPVTKANPDEWRALRK